MDKRRIICLCTTCTTYFQLITAIQMRRTLFSEDYFDIVITDGSNKAQQYSEKLREMKIFDEVFFVTRARDSQEGFSSIGSKISRFCNYFVKGSYVSYLKHPYDLFLSYSFYWYSFMLFNALEQDNHNIKVAKYEEGLISYYVDDHRFEYDYFLKIRKIKRFLHQPLMFDRHKDFYCFYPDFYEGNLNPVRIPAIDREDREFRDILCTMFDVDPDKLRYDKKFIYFASMLAFLVIPVNRFISKKDKLIKFIVAVFIALGIIFITEYPTITTIISGNQLENNVSRYTLGSMIAIPLESLKIVVSSVESQIWGLIEQSVGSSLAGLNLFIPKYIVIGLILIILAVVAAIAYLTIRG